MKPTILLMDNVIDFLESESRLLEYAGYRVLSASTIDEAENIIQNRWFHLAILDLRMKEENDEHDISGLILAQEPQYRQIPKIILTAYPNYESAVEALGSTKGYPSAIDYVAKDKGPQLLLDRVQHAFGNQVRINWGLTLDWKATNPFALVSRFEAGLEGERLVSRAEELEDLFRRLFYEKDRVRIDRVLWQCDSRVALTIFAFKGAAMDSFVVVCGRNAEVVDEANRAQNAMPKIQSETSTTLANKAETMRFAANAYALAQADLDSIRSLGDVYRSGDKKLFTQAVETLFEKTLTIWQPGLPIPAERALEEYYRSCLGLFSEYISPQAFQVRWQALIRYNPSIKKLIPNPEPITSLLQSVVLEQPILKIRSPGTLTGDNILIDANGRAWLTDFADAGNVPQFWNFTALESAIRFDWVEEKELSRLHEIEECLLDDSHFGRPDLQGVESPGAKQGVRSIQQIRRLASRTVGKEFVQYHLGIFFHAARRLFDFDPAVPQTPNEQARLAHALMAMAMIAAKMEQNNPEVLPMLTGETTLELDMVNRRFKLGAKRANLSPQEFKLARYLFENADKTCAYHDIIKEVFEEKYSAEYLQTMIDRIREKIEPDERSPRYILNVRGVGYRLLLKPE